jgi:hypothetical protein
MGNLTRSFSILAIKCYLAVQTIVQTNQAPVQNSGKRIPDKSLLALVILCQTDLASIFHQQANNGYLKNMKYVKIFNYA